MDRQLIENKERNILILHIAFAALCVVILMVPLGLPIGIRLFALVVIYNLAIPGIGLWLKHNDWVDLWLFVFPFSLFMVLPDWFLCSGLGVLVYPEDSFIKIGPIPVYMAFMWTIPLILIILAGKQVQKHISQRTAYICVATVSLLIFGVAEQTMWALPSWSSQNVMIINHWAVYLVIPEMLLGLSAYIAYEKIKYKTILKKAMTAFLIMLLFWFNLVFFYFFVEKVLLELQIL
ncbi:DUF6989 domain-containing protein [Scytonema sp. PRP1]|uniref:DUF6989 domain-containing protein n=1 Tax=Scytonema sp. PRP1 TaxID=3120513 RepID=UPI002FCEA97F